MNKLSDWRRLALSGLLLSQAACIGSSPSARFYLLEPITTSAVVADSDNAAKPLLALADVKVPLYLDRPQLVSATDKNRYQMHELDRWAESLSDNMTRVLRQNLASLLPVDVVSASSRIDRQAAIHLTVTILEFHIDAQGQAGLVAQWQFGRDGETPTIRRSVYRLPADKDDVAGQVGALNQCFDQLSQEMALALQALLVSQ